MGNFECDKDSKVRFCNLLNKIFKNIKIDVPADPQGHLDIFASALTKDNRVIKTYAFELKERSAKYPSTRYGNEGQEGWIYEDGKDEWLMEAWRESGYTPCYVNLFCDGKIMIWDMSKDNEKRLSTSKLYHRHTVDNEGGTYRKRKITLYNKDAKIYDQC